MPFLLKPRISRRGFHFKIRHYHHNNLEYEVKEVFVGHNTLFSLLGFVMGGILVGRSLWEYSRTYLGLPLTIIVGTIIFTISGISLHKFHQ